MNMIKRTVLVAALSCVLLSPSWSVSPINSGLTGDASSLLNIPAANVTGVSTTIPAYVPTMAALKALAVPAALTNIYLQGFFDKGDGGQGFFVYRATGSLSTLTDDGGTVIAPTAVGAGSGRWIRFDRFADTRGQKLNPQWFGARLDGATNDTTAWQNTFLAVSASGAEIIFPAGTSIVTDTLTIATSHTHIKGAGEFVSRFIFNPTSAKTCIKFSAGASELFDVGIDGVGFIGQGTQQKIALSLNDISRAEISHIDIPSAGWTGNSGSATTPSIAIQIKGREFIYIHDCSITADRPVSIERNANNDVRDLDQSRFTNMQALNTTAGAAEPMYLAANDAIDTTRAINLTNVTWDGYQWSGQAKYFFYWPASTDNASQSYNLRFQNIRAEHGSDATGYVFYIDHYIKILQVVNAQGDVYSKGYYFRRIGNLTLTDIFYDGTTEALNLDGSCSAVEIHNCFWNTGSTQSLSGLTQVWANQPDVTTNNRSSAGYEPTSTPRAKNWLFYGNPFDGTPGSIGAATSAQGVTTLSLTTPSVLYTSPVTFSNTSGAWSGTLSLISQGAWTILGNGTSGSATPTFETATGTSSPVRATSPTLVTPTIGAATATSITNGVGAVGTPSYTFTGDTNTGWYHNASGQITAAVSGNAAASFINNMLRLSSSLGLTWANTTASTASADTGIGRNTAGVVEINNGTMGTFRDLKTRYYYTTVTNDGSVAGAIGEYISASVVVGSATALTSATPKTVTSISLTAGDWDVTGIGAITGASTGTEFDVAIGTTTNSLTGTVLGDTRCQTPTVSLAGADASLMIPAVRVSLSSTTTYYLIVQETFTVGSPAAYGRISARRVR